ncbi:MAG: sulfatase-like hydrolase/transferase [Spirochaetia bacterium]|nr:sulfatase-like hydrolase/transferase [Spirochaetia bacterium]
MKQKNILVFLTDDHGAWASRPYGNSEVATPTLDFLARTGTRYQNAFTPSPVCSPARACFFTGKLPSQHGIHDWIQETADPEKSWLDHERNLGECLQTAGYQTALVGKWHCGRGQHPQKGFDKWFSHAKGQYPHFGKQLFSDQGKIVERQGRQSTLLTDEALSYLRTRESSKPFFLFVGLVDTHSPFSGHPERLVSRYRDARFSDIPSDRLSLPAGMKNRPEFSPKTPEESRQWLAQYYAAVTHIDEQMGRVIDELETLGVLDETLVVYTSDHGHMNGHHGLYTKGNGTVPQNFYDESIRIPLLIRAPGLFPAGETETSFVDHLDLFQTLASAGGVHVNGESFPGKSFLPEHPEAPLKIWREEQFCEYGNARMIRTSRHKLIQRFAPHAPASPDELYDLLEDPRETTNRFDEPALAGIQKDLLQKLEEHFQRYEIPEKSGTKILDQPVHNAWEPWRLK